MKSLRNVVLFLFALAVPLGCWRPSPMGGIAESHIRGNVPERADFGPFMERDLGAYFGNLASKPVRVTYELLRDGPTQTGVGYPKFYLWVTVNEGSRTAQSGAVRVAAIEKKRFEVTHFLSVAEIRTNPEAVYTVFPRPVGDKIRAKSK